jgi:hypothetical protein
MQIVKVVARNLYCAFYEVWTACHWAVGNLRRLRRYVRRVWPGNDVLSDSRQHAVYVHYDCEGVIHNYVIKQLEALMDAGFRTTFVSNSPKFPITNVTEVAPFCRQILWRRNVGYDFGGYKDGLRAIGDLENVDRLLLMNDSVYGPFCQLSEMLARIDALQTDVWGITDSWQHHYHVQSYFVLFLGNAIRSPAFQRFWRRLPYVNWKTWIIHQSEIKLTQVLTQQKLRVRVLAPYYEVAKVTLEKLQRRPADLSPVHLDFLNRLEGLLIRGIPLNSSHVFWETLLTDFGCPFLKREAIVTNPVELPFIWRWDDVIARVSRYDPDLIRQHLQAL